MLTRKLRGKVNYIVLDWMTNLDMSSNRAYSDLLTPEELIDLSSLLSPEGRVILPSPFFSKFFDFSDSHGLAERFDVIVSKYDFRKEKDQAQAIDNSSPDRKEVRFKEDAAELAGLLNVDYILRQQEIDRTKWGIDKAEAEQQHRNYTEWHNRLNEDTRFRESEESEWLDSRDFFFELYSKVIKESLAANPEISASELQIILTRQNLDIRNLPLPFIYYVENEIGRCEVNRDLLYKRG